VSSIARPIEVLREAVLAKRTGTLSITTATGAAEIRLSYGVVEDAVYLRTEGEKALYRVLALDEARCRFHDGDATGIPRIEFGSEDLFERAPRLLDEMAALRAQFSTRGPLVAVDADDGGGRPLTRRAGDLLGFLGAPILLDELLDAAPSSDVEILGALAELERCGRLRKLASVSMRYPLATSEQLGRILERLTRTYAAGARVRVVFAGTAPRLAILAHSALCLETALPPAEGVPSLPMPHPVARLALDEQIELEIAVCPLVAAYSPLWPMALARAAAVVRLEDAPSLLFDHAADAAGARVLDALMLVGPYDEANVIEVAMLVRAALEG